MLPLDIWGRRGFIPGMRFKATATALGLMLGAGILSGRSAPAQTKPPAPPIRPRVVPASPASGTNARAVSTVVTLPAASTTVEVQSAQTNAAAHPGPDPFKWDAIKKEVTLKEGELSAQFHFFVTNVSSSEVQLNGVHASCGCTVARLPSQPYKLSPGAYGKIDVTLDVRGRFGTVIKTVAVDTSAGPRELYILANVPQSSVNPMAERLLNQQIAKADRQAVFRGDCARCHLAPALGKKGEELFAAACSICHLSENRASVVPDLATLKVDTNEEYWRLWITYGKVGSLMPAFSQNHGGPLTQDQIHSLVEYLTRRYPGQTARNQATTSGP